MRRPTPGGGGVASGSGPGRPAGRVRCFHPLCCCGGVVGGGGRSGSSSSGCGGGGGGGSSGGGIGGGRPGAVYGRQGAVRCRPAAVGPLIITRGRDGPLLITRGRVGPLLITPAALRGDSCAQLEPDAERTSLEVRDGARSDRGAMEPEVGQLVRGPPRTLRSEASRPEARVLSQRGGTSLPRRGDDGRWEGATGVLCHRQGK